MKKDSKMAREAWVKKLKSWIFHRKMPAELLNELFSSMPVENAFRLLAIMPNGLLARNVQKMINGIKEAMKNNKWNAMDCGSKLSILENGLVVKHSGPAGLYSVRGFSPIPVNNANKPLIPFYFEIQILSKLILDNGIAIGFCCGLFPLEAERLGLRKNSNSIGIGDKYGMRIDGFRNEFKKAYGYFEKDDFVGLGIIHQPNGKMECFATWNGEFLGKIALPAKFANLQLFPAVTLTTAGDSIRVNFGKEEWQFIDFKRIIE